MATKKIFDVQEESNNNVSFTQEEFEDMKQELEELRNKKTSKGKEDRTGKERTKARIMLSRFNNRFSMKEGIIFGHNGQDHYVKFGEEKTIPYGIYEAMQRHIEANTRKDEHSGTVTTNNVHFQVTLIEEIWE